MSVAALFHELQQRRRVAAAAEVWPARPSQAWLGCAAAARVLTSPAPLARLPQWYAEAEKTNGRWAMAAVAGILFTEILGKAKWFEVRPAESGSILKCPCCPICAKAWYLATAGLGHGCVTLLLSFSCTFAAAAAALFTRHGLQLQLSGRAPRAHPLPAGWRPGVLDAQRPAAGC